MSVESFQQTRQLLGIIERGNELAMEYYDPAYPEVAIRIAEVSSAAFLKVQAEIRGYGPSSIILYEAEKLLNGDTSKPQP